MIADPIVIMYMCIMIADPNVIMYCIDIFCVYTIILIVNDWRTQFTAPERSSLDK